jgi:hemerythrin-like metal-binding protein
MTETEWGDKLMLSAPLLDSEHAALIAKVSEFSAALDAGASRAELEMRLTRLMERFQLHFDAEESLMQSSGFPGLKQHAEEHRKLIGQMSVLRDDLGSGWVKLCGALGLFVRLWTEQHITGPDASFAHFLREGKPACGEGLPSIER